MIGTIIGALIGALASAGTTWLTARNTNEMQHQQLGWQRSQRSKETNEFRCRPDSGYSGDSATHLRRMSDPMKQILAVVVVAVVVDAKTNAIKPVTNSAMAISFNTAQLIHSTPMVLRN